MPQVPIITTEQLAKFSSYIARCFDRAHIRSVPDYLATALKDLVPHDFTTCLVLKRNSSPITILKELPPDIEPIPFSESPYLLDPLYQRMIAGKLPVCCSLRDIMPDGFEDSEFHRYYYGLPKSFDEFSFNIPVADGTVFHLAMTLAGESQYFDDRARSLFVAVEPLVSQAVRRFMRSQHQDLAPAYESGEQLHQHLSWVLENFGNSVLTRRESEVLRTTVKGYSDTLAADLLSISPSTLRNHKKNIFRKLGVSSQGQVFGLLLDALRLPRHAVDDADPLIALLRSRQAAENG